MDSGPHTSITIWVISIISSGAILSTLLQVLPPVAALVAFVWYLIQIYESPTIQRWIAMRRMKRLARLKAEVLMLETKIAPMPPGMDI